MSKHLTVSDNTLSDISNNYDKNSNVSKQIMNSNTEIGRLEDNQQISFENFVSGIQQTSAHKTHNFASTPQLQSKLPTTKSPSQNYQQYNSQLQINRLKLQNKHLQQQLQTQSQKVAHHKQQHIKTSQRLQKKQQSQKILNEKLLQKQKQLNEEKKKYQKQQKQKQQLIYHLQNSKEQQLNKYKDIIQKIKKKNGELLKKINDLQDKNSLVVKQLNQEIQTRSKDIRVKDKQIWRLQQIIKQRSQYYDTTIENKSKQIQQLRQHTTMLSQQISQQSLTSQCQIQIISNDITKLQSELNSLTELNTTYQNGLKQLIAIIQVTNQHRQCQYRSNNPHKIPIKKQINHNQLLQSTKKQLMSFIKKTNDLLKQKSTQKIYQKPSEKYLEQFIDLQSKMNILIDENNYLRGQVEKNIGFQSFEKVRFQKQRSLGEKLSHQQIYSRNSILNRHTDLIQGNKNMFKMRIKDLQRERKFHSVDFGSHTQSHPHLLLGKNLIGQKNVHNNKISHKINFDSKSTNYFIQQTRKIQAPGSNAPAIFINNKENNLNKTKTKIRQEIENVRQIFEGTNLKDIVSARKQLGPQQKKRGKSMPSLKKQGLSWKKPRSRVLAELAI